MFDIEQTAKLHFGVISHMARIVAEVRAYLTQRGVFARVAKQLGLDPSYISRVANGKRRSKRILSAIEAELGRRHTSRRKIAQPSSKST